MQIFDISLTITPQLPVWPGDPQVVLERIEKIEEGANANVSRLDVSTHTGTHVDAPVHFIPGKTGVDVMPLQVLIGSAVVIQLPAEVDVITSRELETANIPAGVERVLFKTRNSAYWSRGEQEFMPDFVGISKDGAEYLVQLGVRLVGIDYLSIAPYKQSRPTHEVLLSAGMVVVEGLDLSQVEPGSYTLYCLPLKLGDSDGAPARAVLIKEG